MKPSRSRSALALGLAMVVASSTQAQTVSNGPYYAKPSWDLKIPCETPATCPRFVVLADWNQEAVLDRETGLVWTRAPAAVTPANLIDAVVTCMLAEAGGRRAWRLPAFAEFQSLTTAPANTLPNGHPFNLPGAPAFFWTATTIALGSNSQVFSFNPRNGAFREALKLGGNDLNGVWCVRGGAAPATL